MVELINDGKIICFDLDGVITKSRYANPNTDKEPEPNTRVIEQMRRLHSRGWIILIYTSRSYKDSDSTIKWLKKHKVPFHGIDFNKPLADFYIDDRWYPPYLLEFLDTGEWTHPDDARRKMREKRVDKLARLLHQYHSEAIKAVYSGPGLIPFNKLPNTRREVYKIMANFLLGRVELEETCLTDGLGHGRD